MKFLAPILALFISTSAMATKARLEALSIDDDGSYFLSDDRNIFLNAAYINEYKDQLIFEWGGAGAQNIADAVSGPKAMGGFLKSWNNFVYGAYVGNESDTGVLLRLAASDAGGATSVLAMSDNIIDLFFGGDHGFEWGFNLVYSDNKDEAQGTAGKTEENALAVRLGVRVDEIEGFANISLANESEDLDTTNKAKFDGKLGLHLGGHYDFGLATAFVSYKTFDWDQINNSITDEGSFKEWEFGLGSVSEMTRTARLIFKLAYFWQDVRVEYAAASSRNNDLIRIKRLPVIFGFEKDALEWLTLRASITHNLIGKRRVKYALRNTIANALVAADSRYGASQTNDNYRSIPNSTAVNAGATLTFGKLSIDGAIGITSGARNDASYASAGGGDMDGVLTLDNFLGRVAAVYKF